MVRYRKYPEELGNFRGELQEGIGYRAGSQHFLSSQTPRHTRSQHGSHGALMTGQRGDITVAIEGRPGFSDILLNKEDHSKDTHYPAAVS